MASNFLPQQPKVQDPKIIGQWKVGRTIGRGCSGRVRIARHSKTGQYAAIKIISKSSLAASRVSLNRLAEEVEREKLAVEREIVVMKLIDHPNIMHLYDVWETSSHLYLVLEYIQGGELFDHLCKHGPLSITETLKYFHQIISAVDYFHRFNIAHRDLKPENILLDHNLNIKIADFGMAAWQINSSGVTDFMKTSCGSPHYAAPEIIRGDHYVGSAADIWSCGVILYAMLTAQLPFDDDNLSDLLDKVTAGKFTIPPSVDPLAQNLIRRMLAVNVKKRITMAEIFVHPFFKLHIGDAPVSTIPELSRIARPLKSKSCIDPDIFANLRTLWHGASDEDLMKSLLNEDKNWQKGIYHLLVNYRARQAAEDDVSDDEMEQRRARRAKKIAEKKAKKAAAIILEQHASGNLITPSCSDALHPPRAEPPTPRKARGRYFISGIDADANTGFAKSRSGELDHLMLDVRIPPLMFTDVTHKSGKLDLNRALPAIPASDAEDQDSQALATRDTNQPTVSRLTEKANQPGLSKPSTKAQSGESDRRDLDSERSTLKRASGQLVFSLGLDNARFATNHLITTTRPLSIKRRSQGTTRTSGKRNAEDKENIHHSENRNCLVNFSDTAALRRKLSLTRRYGYNELGCCTHGRVFGQIDGERTPPTQYSQTGSDSHPSPGGTTIPSPRRTWLDVIFRPKPSYSTKHTLYSTWDIITTRNECRRLLMNMNIQVQVVRESQNSFTDRDEGTGAAITMKCKMDEMDDSTGILGVMKLTKFRVEMRIVPIPGHRAISLSSWSGDDDDETDSDEDKEQVMVTLIHEKGSGESFREIVRRLKKEWTLENGGTVGVL